MRLAKLHPARPQKAPRVAENPPEMVEGTSEPGAKRAVPPALAAVRQATGDDHHRLERRLGILERAPSPEGYRALLAGLYGYHAPFEAKVGRFEGWGELDLAIGERRKAHLLRADLRALGLSERELDALPLCEAIEPLRDLPDALGRLYVLEGSTLGGRVIARHLRARLGPEAPLAFFEGYGGSTGARWRGLVEALAAVGGAGPEAERAVVDAARATFLGFEAWLDSRGLLAA